MSKKINYKVCNKEVHFENYIIVLNPATNQIYKEVPALNKNQIDEIYKYSKSIQPNWAKKTISQRAVILNKWADLLIENKEELADILVNEIAKNYNDAVTEVVRSAQYIKYTVEEMYRLDVNGLSGEQYYDGDKNKIGISKRIPLGVILAISPFNYPINLSVSKIAPALISGNTVIFKPATQGTVVAIRIVQLLEEAGLDSGLVSIVSGYGREIGDYLVEKEEIDMVSFTGGTNTGKRISEKISMIGQVMELGGKDAAIVLDDADLDFVCEDIVAGAFNYSGQRCTAIKRVLVSTKNAKELTDKIVRKVEKLSIGNPKENKTIVPLISTASADYVHGLIDDAKENGQKIEIGGKREGNLIYPTVVSNVKRSDRLAIEEPFGPVLPIIEYKDIEEAIEINNESEFGLQASIYGNDINEIMKIAPQLEVGSVNVNGKTSRGPDNFPFIGYKNSGVGVQGIKDSLISMTKNQNIVINIE